MKISLTSIPHDHQRYDTVGDWIAAHGHLRHVRVSELGREDYAFLVGIHELIEGWLCLRRGITQEAVDAFDMQFEASRVEGNTDEPGDDPHAPYRREHAEAEGVERHVAGLLGIDWNDYDRTVAELSQ